MPRFARQVGVGLLVAVMLATTGCSSIRSFFKPRRLAQDVAAMEDPVFPDERRAGIAGLQKRPEGKEAPYTDRFQQIARTDTHPSVRAQAVRALNQARVEQAKPIFIASLSDPEPRVRLEGAKALRHFPDEAALARLTQLVTDENQDRDVRIWAANALSRQPRIDVARTLTTLLEGRDFAVAYEARLGLRRMTGGKDYHYDPGLWLAYLTETPAPFPATQRAR
jgi:hypothetical protein